MLQSLLFAPFSSAYREGARSVRCYCRVAGGQAAAQTYPQRPINVVVPFPPGGGADVTMRMVSEPLEESLGQSLVIVKAANIKCPKWYLISRTLLAQI